jgi:hypothetical protein
MITLAVDPGNEKSAWAVYDTETKKVLNFAIEPNGVLLKRLCQQDTDAAYGFGHPIDKLAMEMIASYGMAVGKTVFDTCVWIGRFIQAWLENYHDHQGCEWEFIYRKDEKMLLCGTMKAKDSNIRQAIMDRYGSTRQKVLGTKKNPGPLYGVSKDVWAAIAVAITEAEMER